MNFEVSDIMLHHPLINDPVAQTIFDSLTTHIAILDAQGTILDTNRAWREYAQANGNTKRPDGIGTNYLAVCDRSEGDEAAIAHQVAAGIRDVINGDREEFLIDYPCHSPTEKRWYYLRAVAVSEHDPNYVVISHENITLLKLAEEDMRLRGEQLERQKQELEETNIALKVLLQQREKDKQELEQQVLRNFKKLVLPYVEKLQAARLRPREKAFVDIIAANLNDIISPFLSRVSGTALVLTPQEIQVADLVRDGKASKEIADILSISTATVSFHRRNLRKKLGLSNKSTNLRTYLQSLAD